MTPAINRHSPGTPFLAHPLAALLLIIGVGLLMYCRTFQAPFVFDDIPNITKNHHIRMTQIHLPSIRHVLKGPDASTARPLAMLTFALNYFFHQYQTTGYHVVNLAIHLAAAFLVFLITGQTLRLCRIDLPAAPVLTALLWLAHPLHIQSVTYIVQRMTALATLLYLLALFCFIKGRIDFCNHSRWSTGIYLWFSSSAIAGLLALLCKPIAGTLPLTLFFYEWYFLHNLDISWVKRRFRWIVLSITLFGVIAAIYLTIIPLGESWASYRSQPFVMSQRLLTELRVIIYYLSLLFVPHPARLNLNYDFPLSFGFFNPAVTALSLTALISLFAAALLAARKHRLISFAILWFLTNLTIESSLIGLALIYEHRTYLPSVFAIMAFTVTLLQTFHPQSRALGGTVLIITILAISTYQRNTVWQTDVSIWRDCVRKSPCKAGPRNNLGTAYARRGKYQQATRQHQIALHLRQQQVGPNHPDTAASYNNLGGAYRQAGNYAKAIACHQKALDIRQRVLGPDHLQTAESYNNLGIAYKHQGDYARAARNYKKALAITLVRAGPRHPNAAVIYHNLNNISDSSPVAGPAADNAEVLADR